MFKAVLLGQWHSLSDPELEHSLIPASIQPVLPFDELSIPDSYSGLTKTSTALPRLSSKRTIL
ncbi:transposase, IS4 family domain protein [Neisseria meningitidis NM3131]|nr:transposase, IS4 family domain protein [Neisseria meningitidis NM3131]